MAPAAGACINARTRRLVEGARHPSAAAGACLVGTEGARQVEARTWDVPTGREGEKPYGPVVVQGPKARLEVLEGLAGRLPAAVPTESEAGRAREPTAPVRQDGPQVLARASSVAGSPAARAATVAAAAGALADGQAGHGVLVVGDAAASRVAVPGLHPAKRAGVAPVADTGPVQVARLRAVGALLGPAVLPRAEAEAFAPVNALALPGPFPAIPRVDKAEVADADAAFSVAGSPRVRPLPPARACAVADTASLAAVQEGATRRNPAAPAGARRNALGLALALTAAILRLAFATIPSDAPAVVRVVRPAVAPLVAPAGPNARAVPQLASAAALVARALRRLAVGSKDLEAHVAQV